jgi:hypothetical protein
LYLTEFRNCEEELKNALAASKGKVRDLEISLREAEPGGQELKRAMKEATIVSTPSLKSWLMRQELVEALKSNLRLFEVIAE